MRRRRRKLGKLREDSEGDTGGQRERERERERKRERERERGNGYFLLS